MSEQLRELAIWLETTRAILIEKGIVTEKEFADRHAQMVGFVDQKLAELREVELAAMNPVRRTIYEALEKAGFNDLP